VHRAKLRNAAHDVSPLHLGEAGGDEADDRGRMCLGDRVERLDDVLISADDRHHVIHGRGLEGNGLAEVPGEEDLAEGGAPCAPCSRGSVRPRPMNANEAPMGWLTLSGLTASALAASLGGFMVRLMGREVRQRG